MSWRGVIAVLGMVMSTIALPMSNSRADTILVFGQSGDQNLFSAVRSGGSTALSAVDIPILITNITGLATPLPAYFSLSATSDTPATIDGFGHIQQNFNGTFEIYSGLGMTGIDYLSGKFDDTMFGGGTGAIMTASTAGGSSDVTFTSDVIPWLNIPRAMSLSFTNVTDPLTVVGNSIDSFTSNVSGNFSAAVPEPASVILFGVGAGAAGLFAACRRMRRG
jgi:hypothetical protein